MIPLIPLAILAVQKNAEVNDYPSVEQTYKRARKEKSQSGCARAGRGGYIKVFDREYRDTTFTGWGHLAAHKKPGSGGTLSGFLF